ncbi:MAG: hypothetical protein ACRD0A_02370 [Acidimicrobiales bacterium]
MPQATTGAPEAMRLAMRDYVRAVHAAYLEQARLLPSGAQGRLPLLDAATFTVVAAGARNLHVIATHDRLGPPLGQEVELTDELAPLGWALRFFDPVVLPALGLIEESAGPATERVRRTLGISTHVYHLVVEPGAELGPHHAGHAGAGLANAHGAEARDFDAIRHRLPGQEAVVDEIEGAARAGLARASALLARELVPWDEKVARLASEPHPAPVEVRRALLAAVRKGE